MDRRVVLAVALAGLSLAAAVVLAEVLWTVVFAVTVAYVLSPVSDRLARRGASRRVAAAITSLAAGLGAVALVAPLFVLLWLRLGELLRVIRALPRAVPLSIAGFETVIETGTYVAAAAAALRSFAPAFVTAAPVMALKATLFVVLVYGLLYKPTAVGRAARALVPAPYHDLLAAYHERTRDTLVGIYVLQAATAAATAAIALVVFWALGYRSPLTLALLSGILQFVPVVGPSIVVLGLAATDLVAGATTRAVLVTAVGLFFVGFVPDAVVRTRLSGVAARMPTSLYFVGFVGGVLTVGLIGFVVGPLVVALVVETVLQLSAESRRRGAAPTADAQDDGEASDRGGDGEASDRDGDGEASDRDGDGEATGPADDETTDPAGDPERRG